MPATGTIAYPYARGLDTWGHSHVSPFQYTGPSAYATGGDSSVVGAVIKLGKVEMILGGIGIATSGAATAVIFVWNPVTLKVQAFWGNAGTAGVLPEVDNATDLSGYQALMIAFGKS